ncbi:MAG: N-acetylmuramoyl-L-alanine amidase [Chlorobi bacterium]|nr:N-acetylmuramoyl-L-alanine amidase [Chlorobiota bacterium]
MQRELIRYRPVVQGIILVFLCLIPLQAAFSSYSSTGGQSTAVSLRDITVTPLSNAATITFLVTGSVQTVVIEKKGTNVAQVRMKSMKATDKALNSALPKPGVISVQAHIERADVLVTDVRFKREVTSMSVIQRTSEKVVVRISLGKELSASEQQSGNNSSSEPSTDWSLSTIVIDPGHGGKDPGAIGIGDVQEKAITLSVAKKLRDELKKSMPGVNIVMTRENDSFVEIYKRGEIANKKKGKLFISIHCNSMPEKPHPATGFECWILRPGKSDDAARVASRENNAIQYESNRKKYDTLDAEIAILGSLAQSASARYSEQLAANIRSAMKRKTPLADRGIHQAGFYVLVGASMPAVLLELGYLSNQKDVKTLKSTSGQQKMAKALAEGIKNFEKGYAESLGD